MKALVVDDDIVSRMALMDLLSAYGVLELVEADDGAAAWALLEQGLRPEICFCDVRMPRMSGIDLLQRMKADATLATVPFVLVSAASDRDTVLQAVTLGAVGYILKPLHAVEARAVVAAEVAPVAAEQLVAAHAGEDHGDVAARELRHEIRGDEGGVEDRLVEVPRNLLQHSHCIRRNHILVVFGAEVFGDAARKVEFVVARVG